VAGSLTFPIVRAFQRGVRTSFLVAFFADQILPLIYASVRPVLPRESEFIFRVR
jgi:membrane protein required for colicin V production